MACLGKRKPQPSGRGLPGKFIPLLPRRIRAMMRFDNFEPIVKMKFDL